jgi:hypothetical protein
MLTATKAKRTTTKLVTDNNRELVVVCCLDKRRGIVLAVLGDGTGDCWAEELHADHVRGLTPDDVYCDAMPLLERRAKCTIDDEGRLER